MCAETVPRLMTVSLRRALRVSVLRDSSERARVIETECRAPQRGPGGLHIGNGMAWDVLTPPSACFLVLFTCCLFVVCGSAFYTNRSTPLNASSLIAI